MMSAWGHLECLYKACQAAMTDGSLFTDTGVNERSENERQSENDSEMLAIYRSRGQRTNKSWCEQDKRGKDCSTRNVLNLEWN